MRVNFTGRRTRDEGKGESDGLDKGVLPTWCFPAACPSGEINSDASGMFYCFIKTEGSS